MVLKYSESWGIRNWEMESLFFGESANAFYKYEELNNARKLKTCLYPIPYYQILGDRKVKYKHKTNGEIRLIGMDIATMGGAKNDATCFSLIQMLPLPNNQYIRYCTYMETMNGGHTYDQSIRLRQLYDDFEADFVVIDTNGAGISVFDALTMEQTDPTREMVYPAWSCINDDRMAERCKDVNAPKIIYSIKASATMNSEMAVYLRDAVKRGKLLLLAENLDPDMAFKNKAFLELSMEEQLMFSTPFMQTTLLVNEMVNLDYETVGGKIRVHEASGQRKDRYSSLSYAYYISHEIERENYSQRYTTDFSKVQSCVSSVDFNPW